MIGDTKCTTKSSNFEILSTITTMGHRRSKKQAEMSLLCFKHLREFAKKRWKNPSELEMRWEFPFIQPARRLKGGRSMAKSREGVQLLSIREEKALL